MKNRPYIWIPPDQTTLRKLAELNKKVNNFRNRSKAVKNERTKEENLILKKLAGYQADIVSIQHHSSRITLVEVKRPKHQAVNWTEMEEIERYYHRVEELVAAGIERLAVGNSPALNERFKTLENELSFYSYHFHLHERKTPQEVTNAQTAILESVQARINAHLHQLQNEIAITTFRLRNGLAIDRRARFRSIVHFIFKNLDDYDSNDYVLRAA